jgi:hypothetical protein
MRTKPTAQRGRRPKRVEKNVEVQQDPVEVPTPDPEPDVRVESSDGAEAAEDSTDKMAGMENGERETEVSEAVKMSMEERKAKMDELRKKMVSLLLF